METANRFHFHFPFTFHVKRNFTFRASVNVNDDGCSHRVPHLQCWLPSSAGVVPRPSRQFSSAAESPTMPSPIRKVPQGNNLWEEIGGQACHSLTRVSTRELRENQVRRPLNSSAQPRAPAARVDAERPHPRIQPSGRPEAPQEVRSGRACSTEPAGHGHLQCWLPSSSQDEGGCRYWSR